MLMAGSIPLPARRCSVRAVAANGHDELFLIDGNSLAYRAFFALPESIATSTGFPTNTIFGFASMLVKLLTEYGSKPTIVVWDAGSSGRKEVSADYKATRRSRPDLLKEQWPHLEPLVDAFGYRNIAVDGFEADDVIATIADRARDAGVPVMVVTGDRDAFQIIDPESRVKVMATGRGITDTKIYDHQAVIDRYGIAPELIPDFYGLKGDTSDNIPGVPGIGDKTASELLQRFGSLEEVLAHIDDISGAKRKENLTAHADNARLSKLLATIKLDVPVEVDPVAEAAREPDRSRLREVFREFELRAPLARLEEAFGEGDDGAAPAPGRGGHGQGAGARGLAGRRGRLRARQGGHRRGRRAGDPGGPARPDRHPLALRRGRRRERARRRVREPRGARRGARRSPGRRPRRQGARRRAARPGPRHACWPPTCSSPRAGASRSARSARSAAWPPTSTTRPGPTPSSCRRSPRGSASSSPTAAWSG